MRPALLIPAGPSSGPKPPVIRGPGTVAGVGIVGSIPTGPAPGPENQGIQRPRPASGPESQGIRPPGQAQGQRSEARDRLSPGPDPQRPAVQEVPGPNHLAGECYMNGK